MDNIKIDQKKQKKKICKVQPSTKQELRHCRDNNRLNNTSKSYKHSVAFIKKNKKTN